MPVSQFTNGVKGVKIEVWTNFLCYWGVRIAVFFAASLGIPGLAQIALRDSPKLIRSQITAINSGL